MRKRERAGGEEEEVGGKKGCGFGWDMVEWEM